MFQCLSQCAFDARYKNGWVELELAHHAVLGGLEDHARFNENPIAASSKEFFVLVAKEAVRVTTFIQHDRAVWQKDFPCAHHLVFED